MAIFASGLVRGGSFDGDHPGFTSVAYDATTSTYTLTFDSAPSAAAVAQFSSPFPGVVFASGMIGATTMRVQTRRQGKPSNISQFDVKVSQ